MGPWGSLVSFLLGVQVTPVQIWTGPPNSIWLNAIFNSGLITFIVNFMSRSKVKIKRKIKRKIKHNIQDRNLTPIETAIIECLENNPNVTQVEIVNTIKRSRGSVQDAMSSLKKRGMIKREGSKKKGKWIVITKSDDLGHFF